MAGSLAEVILPAELWELTFWFLDGRELGVLCCVCNTFNNVINSSKRIWEWVLHEFPAVRSIWAHYFVADSSRPQNSPLFDAVGAYRQEYIVKYAERSLRCVICSAKNQQATGFICKDCSSALSKHFLLEPIEQDELHHALITPLEAQKRYDLTKLDLKFLKERGYASTIVLESEEPVQKKKKRRRCNTDYGIWDSGPLTYFPELRVVLLALSKNRSEEEDDPLFG